MQRVREQIRNTQMIHTLIGILYSLVCSHEWTHLTDLYGDSINQWNARSLWTCDHCGKIKRSDTLHNPLCVQPIHKCADPIPATSVQPPI